MKKTSGFTLVELLITTAVIGAVLAIGLVNYTRVNRQQIFRQSVKNTLEDLRLAQDKALSGEKPSDCLPPTEAPLTGYRFVFTGSQSYEIRAVCEGISDESVCKSAALKGEVQKTTGPNSILFKVLGQGADLGGTSLEAISFAGYGLEEQIVVTESGEIYLGPEPTETPSPLPEPSLTPEPTAAPTLTPTPTSVPLTTPTPTSIPTSTPTPLPTATPPPPSGLTLYSTLDDSSAVTNPDPGVGGGVNGGSFVTDTGRTGYLADEDGEYVHFPMAGNLDAQRGTIDFWYKKTVGTIETYARFFSSSKGNVQWSLYRMGSDTSIRFRSESDEISNWDSVPNVFDGSWHQIRFTYDTVNDSYYLYIDGVSQGEKTEAHSDVDIGSYDLHLGNRGAYYDRPVGGIMDEFRVYSEVVPPSSATPTPTPTVENLIINPGFESGNSPWMFYTDGAGDFSSTSPGYEGSRAARVYISEPGSNVQLYQYNLALEPDTNYRLSFAAYSNTGHDFYVYIHKHGSPYTNYGLSAYRAYLGSSWGIFSVEFTSTSDAGPDARLRFWFAPFDASGDVYWIDQVELIKV